MKCLYCENEYEWNGTKYIKEDGEYKAYDSSKFCSTKCSKANRSRNIKRNNLAKYGIENYVNAEAVSKTKQSKTQEEKEKIQQKRRKTTKERYGVDINFQSEEVKKQIRETKLEKYGNEYYDNREKIKQTMLERYGAEHPLQVPDIIEKRKETNKKKWGVEFTLQSNIVKEKSRKTCLDKYGVEISSQSSMIKSKIDHKVLQKKRYNTQKKNKSFNKSKIEDKIYELLLIKFPTTLRHYHTDAYPFACDFYIQELDLYIEYQGTWTHGKEPYNSLNIEHQVILETWHTKDTKFYDNAIHTWTIRDVKKREYAKEHNLNWLEFFNEKDFMNWYENSKHPKASMI